MALYKMTKRKIKIYAFIAIPISVCIIIVLVFSTLYLDNKQKAEINKVINSLGGKVSNIQKVDRKLSPFSELSTSSNIIYRVFYDKNGEKYEAWYRGVSVVNNIHSTSSSGNSRDSYGEKWIFEDIQKKSIE